MHAGLQVEVLLIVVVQHMHATERIHDCNDKVQRTLLWSSMIRFYMTRMQDAIQVKQVSRSHGAPLYRMFDLQCQARCCTALPNHSAITVPALSLNPKTYRLLHQGRATRMCRP